MFFNTIQYLVFLPLVMLLYYSVLPKYRWIVLFLSSCFFYMYFIPKYILCLFFLIIVDFFMAKKIDKELNEKKRKAFLVISIVSNFGLLFYFKYLLFFAELLNLFWIKVAGEPIKVAYDILPIGLSFHTFQSVSYVIDVYKRKITPEKHLGVYSTYVLFFPQMVAGPIERFSTLGNELKKHAKFESDFLRKGLALILIGFFYKMVIADNCGEYVNQTYGDIGHQNNYNVLIAICLFCVQIYSDFFGYSLIAQGSARLFGISLIDNFSFPFFSQNIVEFWKKWHISLTSWFRDYVYIPLGGNRTSRAKYCLNISIVFGLSGLWHGAGINFIVWGLLHAAAYLLFVVFINKNNIKLPAIVNYLATFMLVAFIFVFFRNSFHDSMIIFQNTFRSSEMPFRSIPGVIMLNVLIAGIIEYFARRKTNYLHFVVENAYIKNLLLFGYMAFAILTFSGVDNLPFIYFQF